MPSGSAIQAEILWPTAAKSTASQVTVYARPVPVVQPLASLKILHSDVTVPGTVPFEVGASAISGGASLLPTGGF